MNKSLITNLIALTITLIGFFVQHSLVFSVGLFALSGAVTNTLAVHMLFEKVPGLYGSGVVESRFEEFKIAIKNLLMNEFFNSDNIARFLSNDANPVQQLNLEPVIEKIDFEPAYDSLVSTVNESQFGGMLAMFGGTAALEPLKTPFIEKIKLKLIEISQTEQFKENLKEAISQPDLSQDLTHKIEGIVITRLDELNPKMVKEIVQQMIKQHLGWLVIWGGVLGGIFGLVAELISI